MHRQGHDGHPQKFFAFLTSESGLPKKAHEYHRKEGYAKFGARLTFKMSRTGREGQPDA